MEAPAIRLLGAVELRGASGKSPRGPGRLLECVVFLALHPNQSPQPLEEALWPYQRVTAQTRNMTLYRARNWLGTKADGAPWVCHVEEHGYRLDPAVTVDWHQMLALAGPDVQATPTEDLRSALSLVQGRPFSAVDPTKYGWADMTHQRIAEVTNAITAEYLHRLADAPPLQITWATSRSLAVDPSNERTWQAHLTALLQLGHPTRLQQAAHSAELHLGSLGSLSPVTLDLLDQAKSRAGTTTDLPLPLEH